MYGRKKSAVYMLVVFVFVVISVDVVAGVIFVVPLVVVLL